MTDRSDTELLRHGDETAFAEVYRRPAPTVTAGSGAASIPGSRRPGRRQDRRSERDRQHEEL